MSTEATVNASTKLNMIQSDVNEVVDVLKENIQKAIKREEKLNDIQIKAEELQDHSMRFVTTSRKLKRRMWWQKARWWVYVAIGVVMLAGIVVAVVLL